MVKRQLFCDVCACVTDHLIDDGEDDDGGELALCLRCGRLHSAPDDEATAKPNPPPATCAPCRHR